MSYEIIYSCISHIGNVRNINQDNFICNGAYMLVHSHEILFPLNGTVNSKKPLVFGVFDGLGGEDHGEVASFIAAKEASFISPTKNDVRTLINYCETTNRKICEYAKNNSISAMGTTAALLLFSKTKITLCNIGDSKIFMYTDNRFTQISMDHIVLAPFGTKPPLSQNLGIPPDQLALEPYLSKGRYRNGDKYFICSDGLTDMLSPEEIIKILEQNPVTECTTKLVEKALENGGNDNITVIVIEIKKKNKHLRKNFYKRRKTYELSKLWYRN